MASAISKCPVWLGCTGSRGEDVGMTIFQVFMEQILKIDVARSELAVQGFDHANIFRNVAHYVSAIAFLLFIRAEEKGTDEQDLAIREFLFRQG